MLSRWQLQDAKNRFSELVDTAITRGPQMVTRHGEDAVVIVPVDAYRELTRPKGSLLEFFANSPLRGAGLNLTRDRDTGRQVELWYLLDTCLLSELQKPRPSKPVVAWMTDQSEDDLYLSVLTLGEIQKGVSQLPESRKKILLQSWLDRDLRARFRGRIAGITEQVALAWGRISGAAATRGQPLPVIDALIAATAMAIDATVVTRDDAAMRAAGVKTLDPWDT